MKRVAAFLTALALSLSLFGCAQSQSATSEAEAQQQSFTPRLDTEAEVEFDIIGGLENFEALEAVINDFNEIYPNCTVNYESLASYKDNIEARVLSDSDVGIFMMNETYYKSENLANACLDLSQEDIDFSAIQDDFLSAATADGKLYGLPIAGMTTGLAVNETLLENEGLAVPTNYEELKEVCEALKQKGYQPIQGYANFTSEAMDSQYLFPELVQNMIYVTIGNSGNAEETINSFINIEAGCGEVLRPVFERLYEMVENGYISDDTRDEFEDSYNATILRFFEGDLPFVTMNSEVFSGTKKRETKSEAYAASPFEYSYICVPIGDDGAYSYIENWYSFSVNKNCPQSEWAVEFIRFLATEEEINTIASVKGLPSVAKNSTDERFADIYSENEEYTYTNSIYVPIWVQSAMNDVLNRIGTGELTVDEAVTEFETALANYKQEAEAS